MANNSYNVALKQASDIYNAIDEQCKRESRCPPSMGGWEALEPGKRYRTKVGGYITYPLTYESFAQAFSLYLYRSLDLGDRYEGKVD